MITTTKQKIHKEKKRKIFLKQYYLKDKAKNYL